MPLGPAIRKACGMRPLRYAASSAASALAWPNNTAVERGCGASVSSLACGLMTRVSRDQAFPHRHMLRERCCCRLELGRHGVPNVLGDLHSRHAGIDNDATLRLVGGERAERL